MKFNIREHVDILLLKIDIVEIISKFIYVKRSGNNYVSICLFAKF